MPFIYLFFGPITVARTSCTMLNRSGKSRHSCLISALGGKSSSPSLLIMMLSMLWWVFSSQKCMHFVNCCFCTMLWEYISLFIVVIWWIILIDLQMFKQPCIYFKKVVRFSLLVFLWGVLQLIFIRDLVHSFLMMLSCGFATRLDLMESWEVILFLLFYGKGYGGLVLIL
jgi:hypothetical protein